MVGAAKDSQAATMPFKETDRFEPQEVRDEVARTETDWWRGDKKAVNSAPLCTAAYAALWGNENTVETGVVGEYRRPYGLSKS
jgi:hypothetical protein